jgi:hypothetical protein
MAWRPNQRVENSDFVPTVTNAPAAQPNVVHEPKKTHAGKKVDENRAHNIRRDTDKVKDFSITLLDVDTTIIEHLDKTISPTVIAGGEQKKVPIIFGSPERWKAIQKDGAERDQRGRIQLPFIMLKRNTIQRNDQLITFNRYLNMPFQRAYSEKNQYDRFSVCNNVQKPVTEVYNVTMPDHIIVPYECMVWTDYVEQNNAVIEAINFSTEDYWGDERRFKFRTSISDYSINTELPDGDSRTVRTTFTIQVFAYLLPEVREDWAKTTQKAFTPRRVVFGVDLDAQNAPNWPSYSKEDYNAYKGLVMTDGTSVVCGIGGANDINMIIRNPIVDNFTGYIRYYGDTAAWNYSLFDLKEALRLENNTDLLHESSSAKANHIVNYSDSSSIELIKPYSFFDTQQADSLYTAIVNVTSSNSSSANLHQQTMPFHPTWSTADRLVVFDSNTGFEYNLEDATFDTASNIITAHDANFVKNDSGFPINIFTYAESFKNSRDGGIQYGAMTVRAVEVQSGSIHHALSMRLTYPSASYVSASAPASFVDPATKAFDEGEITASLGFARSLSPEPVVSFGDRFFLDITDAEEEVWLNNLSGSINKDAAKTIVTALRDYGWFVTDTNDFQRNSGSHQFDFEADQTVNGYWNGIGFSGSVFANMLDPLFTTSSVKAVIPVDYSTL